MNILIISSPHPNKTAGKVASDLYQSLKRPGNIIKLLVKIWDHYDDTNIIPIDNWFQNKVKRSRIKFRSLFKLKNSETFDNNINTDFHVQDFDQTKTLFSTKRFLNRAKFKPDIILVLFMQNFIGYKELYELQSKTKAKIVLYLMDMAPLTGLCHYAWDCEGFKKNCGCCPAIFSSDSLDQSSVNLSYKYKYASITDIIVLTASNYTFQQAKVSKLFSSKKVYNIPLPQDESIFFPQKQSETRKRLKINTNKKVIFFGSTFLSHKRKGMNYLLEALEILWNKNSNLENEILLLIAGDESEEITKRLKFPYKYLGFLNNHADLAIAYNCADIYLSPSIEDSGPTMINQSIMCGTPVIAFNMGVAQDLVISGKTGYLAKLKDSQDFAEGISNMLRLTENEYDEYFKNCIELSSKHLSSATFANSFYTVLNGR